MKRPKPNIPLISLSYAIGATLWILLSDQLIGHFVTDAQSLVIASTVKGWGFVGITTLLLYGVLQRVRDENRESRESLSGQTQVAADRKRDLFDPLLYGSAALAILVLVAIGAQVINSVSERVEQQITANLQAVAQLKSNQMGNWLQERKQMVELVRSTTPLGASLHRWREQDDPVALVEAKRLLADLVDNAGFQTVEVVNRQGNLVLGTDARHTASDALRTAIKSAIASGAVEFTCFYQQFDVDPLEVHLDILGTIPSFPDFLLVTHIDLDTSLLPLLRAQTHPSSSEETLLLLPGADDLLVLSDLLQGGGAPASRRISYTDANSAVARVATGKAALGDLVSGDDYLGEPVSGVAQAVAGTRWLVFEKVDRAEMYARTHRNIYWIVLALFMAMLAVAASVLLLRQNKALHRSTQRQRDLAEASLNLVFQTLPDLYFRIGADSAILDYRARSDSSLYFLPETFRGKKMLELLPEELKGVFSQHFNKAIETAEVVVFEYQVTLPQGRLYLEARLGKLPDKNELILVVRDVSERRQTLDKLATAKRLYATLSQINQTIFRKPERTRLFQEICEAATEYGKFTLVWIGLVDEARQRVTPVAFSGEGSDYLRTLQISTSGDIRSRGPFGRAILEGRSVAFNDIEQNPDFLPWREQAMLYGFRSAAAFPLELGGKYIGALVVYTTEPDYFDAVEIQLLEEAAQNISFALDVAEKDETSRRAAQALRESDARIRTLVDALPDPVWMKDPDGVYLFCNPRFEQLFGARVIDIIGKTDYDFLAPGVADLFRSNDRAAIEAAASRLNVEELTFASDGHIELVETIKTPMYHEDGTLIGVLGICRNITEHKLAEDKLASQLEELQRWQEMTVGRELRGLQLKREINALLAELGRAPRYPSAELDGEPDE